MNQPAIPEAMSKPKPPEGLLLPGEFEHALAAGRLPELEDLLDWRENNEDHLTYLHSRT